MRGMLVTYIFGLNMSRWKSGCGKGSSSLSCIVEQGVHLWVRLLSAAAVQRGGSPCPIEFIL